MQSTVPPTIIIGDVISFGWAPVKFGHPDNSERPWLITVILILLQFHSIWFVTVTYACMYSRILSISVPLLCALSEPVQSNFHYTQNFSWSLLELIVEETKRKNWGGGDGGKGVADYHKIRKYTMPVHNSLKVIHSHSIQVAVILYNTQSFCTACSHFNTFVLLSQSFCTTHSHSVQYTVILYNLQSL